MKQKIQVTTARIDSAAQVILPNTYFVTKAVKAMLANDKLNANFQNMKNMGQDIDPEISEALETTGNFLHELIDALEGNEPD